MKSGSKGPSLNEAHVSITEFVVSYNQTIPSGWPKATKELLQKFKTDNTTLFKHGELWSIDLHRKRIIDWLPLNSRSS